MKELFGASKLINVLCFVGIAIAIYILTKVYLDIMSYCFVCGC